MKPILIGCPFDNGIRSMLRFKRGVTGAWQAPQAILPQVAPSIPKVMLDVARWQSTVPNPHDVAGLQQQCQDTAEAHAFIQAQLARWVQDGWWPLSVGGDHSLTYPLCSGVSMAQPERLGLVYIDAHLDMRPFESMLGVDGIVSSGNSFRRLIEDGIIAGHRMVAVGIKRGSSAVFEEMLAFAEASGVTIVWQEDCTDVTVLAELVKDVVGSHFYMSVDMDVVAGVQGVSAPAKDGLPFSLVQELAVGLAHGQGCVGMDVVEVSGRELGWWQVWAEADPVPDIVGDVALAETAVLAAQLINAILPLSPKDHQTLCS